MSLNDCPCLLRDVWTIGHSNHAWSEFANLLQAHRIEQVADVRRFPGSRAFPHFGADQLPAELAAAGVAYQHFASLGGRRSRQAGSINQGWRVAAFNAFADHMATPEFSRDFERLLPWAGQRRTALMCSEAVPWRCHRRLIADALLLRGWAVWDVLGPAPPKPHVLTSFCVPADGLPTYPAQAGKGVRNLFFAAGRDRSTETSKKGS